MLDNILNSVRRSAEKVQRRGEEVAHAARLRMEIFQLNRELDALYARLGRSFHAGAEVDVLQGVREDIHRVEDEIRARERLIQELGGDGDDHQSEPSAEVVQKTGNPPAQPEPSAEPSVNQDTPGDPKP